MLTLYYPLYILFFFKSRSFCNSDVLPIKRLFSFFTGLSDFSTSFFVFCKSKSSFVVAAKEFISWVATSNALGCSPSLAISNKFSNASLPFWIMYDIDLWRNHSH